MIDDGVLSDARNLGICELCGKRRPTEGHHLSSRGSGGDDTNENIVAICRICHTDAHMGLIPKEKLREIARNRKVRFGCS